MSVQQVDLYASHLADALMGSLRGTEDIKSKFTSNPNLTGGFAEAYIRAFVADFVHGTLRVCTGGIIAPDQAGEIQQRDCILWKPNPFPPAFRSGNFALVPARSAFGILEVKRSDYSSVTEWADQVAVPRFHGAGTWQIPTLGVVCLASSNTRTAEIVASPSWIFVLDGRDSEPTVNTRGVIALCNWLVEVRTRAQVIASTYTHPPAVGP